LIRHCTSVSHPDGMEYARAGKKKDSHLCNHLYGTFTAELFQREGPKLQQVASCCDSAPASKCLDTSNFLDTQQYVCLSL
jgi:hypothetical protein